MHHCHTLPLLLSGTNTRDVRECTVFQCKFFRGSAAVRSEDVPVLRFRAGTGRHSTPKLPIKSLEVNWWKVMEDVYKVAMVIIVKSRRDLRILRHQAYLPKSLSNDFPERNCNLRSLLAGGMHIPSLYGTLDLKFKGQMGQGEHESIIWGFIKDPGLSITYSWQIGFWDILRAWYRGIKNAGPRKRAQGRAQDIPYLTKNNVRHGIWNLFIECGKTPTRARAKRKGSYPTKKLKEFSTTPIWGSIWIHMDPKRIKGNCRRIRNWIVLRWRPRIYVWFSHCHVMILSCGPYMLTFDVWWLQHCAASDVMVMLFQSNFMEHLFWQAISAWFSWLLGLLFSGSPARFPCGAGIASLAGNKRSLAFWQASLLSMSTFCTEFETVHSVQSTNIMDGTRVTRVLLFLIYLLIRCTYGYTFRWRMTMMLIHWPNDLWWFMYIHVEFVHIWNNSMNDTVYIYTIWYTCTCISWH